MKNPIRRIENSTSTEKISPEFKKAIDAKMTEQVSYLREQRIKQVRSQKIDPQEQYPYESEFKPDSRDISPVKIFEALQGAKDFLSERGELVNEGRIFDLACDWLEDRNPGIESKDVEVQVEEYMDKNRTAQIEPISSITPKQPINDNRVTAPIEKKKESPEGNFGDLLKDSLMEKQATIVKEDGKYCVKSHTGKNLGCSDTHEGAVKRLRQVEFFKHKGQVAGDKAPITCRNCNSQNTKYWTEQGLGGVNTGIECADCGWGSPAWIESHQNE